MHVRFLNEQSEAAQIAASLSRRDGFAWLDGDGSAAGRYSFLACDPVELLSASSLDSLTALSRFARPRPSTACGHVPRWIGYLTYDAASPLPGRVEPALWFGRYDAVLAFDHQERELILVADDRAAADRLLEKAMAPAPPAPPPRVTNLVSAPSAEHIDAVEQALAHIAAGDIYQVNLARRWRADFEGDPLSLFVAMKRASPVPFGMFLATPDLTLCARTMERFLSWDEGRLCSSPIKGTIPRSGRDEAEATALRSDDKERAEHAMIVDLVRNDLSRVAELGTVQVEGLMAVEPYAKLSHLVTTVSCRPRVDTRLVDVVRATFPPGSVTGAPKIRALEIIAALEPAPRGVYCGAVGHVNRDGALRLAVAIRTAVLRGRELVYHAGGGLVSASDPQRELAETELKARVFLDAIESF